MSRKGVNSSPCWSLPLAPSLFLLSTPAHIFQSYCNAGKYDDKLIEVFRRTVNFPSNLYPDVFVNVSRDKYLFIERFSYTFPASITKTFQQGRKNELFRGRRGGRRKKKKRNNNTSKCFLSFPIEFSSRIYSRLYVPLFISSVYCRFEHLTERDRRSQSRFCLNWKVDVLMYLRRYFMNFWKERCFSYISNYFIMCL